jgi:hypothetical protein
MGVAITSGEICSAMRWGFPTRGKPLPSQQENQQRKPIYRHVIVKFSTVWTRQSVYRARFNLQGKNIFVNEDLEKYELDIMKTARDLKFKGLLNSIWSYDLKIFVKTEPKEEARQIKNKEELIQYETEISEDNVAILKEARKMIRSKRLSAAWIKEGKVQVQLKRRGDHTTISNSRELNQAVQDIPEDRINEENTLLGSSSSLTA